MTPEIPGSDKNGAVQEKPKTFVWMRSTIVIVKTR